MSQPLEIEALEARVAADPGAAGFATLVEVYRRLGRLDDARRVAAAGLALRPDDTRGRLALGLTLLDLGETEGARGEFEHAMAALAADELGALPLGGDPEVAFDGSRARSSDGPTEGVADAELDAAFEGAEALRDEMLDANQLAEEAMRQGRLDAPEGFKLDATSTFATETMARLLDTQGDAQAADAIRERIGANAPAEPLRGAAGASPAGEVAAEGLGGTPPDRVLAVLESWLDNLQRSRR